MSGRADTIRRAIFHSRQRVLYTYAHPSNCRGCIAEAALRELEAELVTQADRIAWLEGEAAGWRIKLAECEAESQRLRNALTEIDTFPISEDLSAGYHFAEVRSIAREALAVRRIAQ